MKLGLITDIHENVENLDGALKHFRDEQIDQIIVIGDVLASGKRIDETCQLLSDANAIGVWGNHDFGLCFEPDHALLIRYAAVTVDFMRSLQPRLEFGGCHFTHVEPWLDPEQIADLWYFGGVPDDDAKLRRIFAAVPNRVLFAGHFHKWLLATPEGIADWHGEQGITLAENRYYVVVGALCDGHFATYDTGSARLTPRSLQ